MSRSVDLFIRSDEPIEVVAAAIAHRTGLTVQPRPAGDGYSVSEGDLWARLHRHPFADDDGLPLERYPYALSMETGATGHLGASPQVSMLRMVSDALDGTEVLLVLDLQFRMPAAAPAASAPGGSDGGLDGRS